MILGSVALLTSISACATVDAFDPLLTDRVKPTHDGSGGRPSSPTQTLPVASSSDCESSIADAGTWRIAIGEEDPLQSVSVRADGRCNVFVAGAHSGVRKLDARGESVWVRPFGSIVDVTLDGLVYVAGSFTGELAIDANTTLTSSGGSDAYIIELDAAGGVVSAVALGGPGDEHAESVAAADGEVVISGSGLGTVKLDGDLRTKWQVPLTGAVAMDPEGAVVVAGALVGTETFGDVTLSSAGGEDVLVAKLSSGGEYEWVRRYGDAGAAQHGEAIAVDASGGVLVSGVVDGSVDFGGGPVTVPAGTCPQESWCEQAGFVLKLDRAGAFVWSRSLAPVRSASGVVVDTAGNVIVSGSYPGGVPPYRTPLLASFGPDGAARKLAADDIAAAGHGVAVDLAGNVFFAETALGGEGELGRAYLLQIAVR